MTTAAQLRHDWHLHDVTRVEATGCWIWVGVDPTWQAARRLIAGTYRMPTGEHCARTAACVHPYHGPHTAPVNGAAS